MKYKNLVKIWVLLSISFIGLVLVLSFFAVVDNITIITKPLPTLIALSFIIPYCILLLTGKVLLDRIKKRELGIG